MIEKLFLTVVIILAFPGIVATYILNIIRYVLGGGSSASDDIIWFVIFNLIFYGVVLWKLTR